MLAIFIIILLLALMFYTPIKKDIEAYNNYDYKMDFLRTNHRFEKILNKCQNNFHIFGAKF